MQRIIIAIMAAVLYCLSPAAAQDDPDSHPIDRDGMVRYWWNTDDGADVAGILEGNNFAEVGYGIVDSGSGLTSDYDTIADLLGVSHTFGEPRPFTSKQMKSALTSYTGVSYGNALHAANLNVQGLQRGISRHVDDINKTIGAPIDAKEGGAADCADKEYRFWVGGVGRWERLRDRDDGLTGYRFGGAGLMTGFDRTSGSVSVGGALGYSGGGFKDSAALRNDSRIDSYVANVYATYNPEGNFRAMAMAGYGYSGTKLGKYRAGTADEGTVTGWERAKYGVDTFTLGGKVGYETEYMDGLTLGVTGGLYYQHSRAGGFDSRFVSDAGTGASVIHVDRLRTHSLLLPLDLTVDYLLLSDCESSLTVSGNAGYGLELGNGGASGTLSYGDLVGGVNFSRRSVGRNAMNFGVGVGYETDRLDLTVRHDLYLGSEYTSNRLSGNFGLKF